MHSEPLVPSWHEFQNSVAVENRLCGIPELHGRWCELFRTTPKRCMNVELWRLVGCSLSVLHWCCVRGCAGPSGACPLNVFQLWTTFCRAALTLHHTPTSLSTGVDCCELTHVRTSHYELLRWTKFPVLLPLHINLSSEWHLTDFPTHSVACYAYYKSCFLTKSSILDHHRSCPYWICVVDM
jgi:hypothetical protein